MVRSVPNSGRTAVFRSEGLARSLGMSNLWIAFNGYWPEKGGFLETGTFKELEAYTVLGRMPDDGTVLVVASAGNTAAAFASVCSRSGRPCLLIVPETGLSKFKLREPLHPLVRLVVLAGADYSDAITLSEDVAENPGFYLEGGVRNVGRRDGLGTVMYSAVEEIGGLPEYYFQAVGSAAGGIAVHEGAKRFRTSVGTDAALPKLMFSQNEGFAPIYRSWRNGKRAPVHAPCSPAWSPRNAFADELTNPYPPYGVHSGVYDVLTESGGDVLTVDRESARAAMRLMKEMEGIDIEPAAAVATASLLSSAHGGWIDRDACVLLNITGGGRARMAHDYSLVQAEPDLLVEAGRPREGVLDEVLGLFSPRDDYALSSDVQVSARPRT